MATEPESIGGSQGKFDDYVPVILARSSDEADRFHELLSDHEVPSIIGTKDISSDADPDSVREMSRGVPVLVPEELLDEASEVIAENEDSEFALDDDDEDYLDDDDDETPLGGGLDDDFLNDLDDEDFPEEDENKN